jgi:hypothetical protein
VPGGDHQGGGTAHPALIGVHHYQLRHGCRAPDGTAKPTRTPAPELEAAELFEQLVALASPVGLYGKEMDISARLHLGNDQRGSRK